jgi:hypothetical protein
MKNERVVRRRRPLDPAAVRWTELVWGDLEGVAVVQCIGCRADGPNPDRRHDAETLMWPDDSSRLRRFIDTHSTHGSISATPLLRNSEAANPEREDACLSGVVCWADIDNETSPDEISLRLPDLPVEIVASGGPDRFHAYVPLDRPYAPERIKAGNEALRTLLSADSAHSPAKLLAVPGTHNHKWSPDGARAGRCGEHPGVTFVTERASSRAVPLERILELSPTSPRRPEPSQPARSGVRARRIDELPQYLQNVLSEPPGEKRGGQFWHGMLALMEHGCTDEELDELAPEVPGADKYEDRIQKETERVIEKRRLDHRHEGASCHDASCPNEPEWMAQIHRRAAWQPAMSLYDLMATPLRVDWLVEGLLPEVTAGMIAGQAKSLKSWLATDLAYCIASGSDFLGTFPVPEPGPVLHYVNEGSQASLQTRYDRIARSKGHRRPKKGLSLHIRLDTPGCDSEAFFGMLRKDLEIYRPKIVILDAWYAFHGARTDVTNLMAEGALLRRVQEPCREAGAALLIVNHFAKSAPKELRLSNVTQSGAAEWSDSWMLVRVDGKSTEDVSITLVAGGRSSGETTIKVRARGAMLPDPESDFNWETETDTKNLEEKIKKLLSENSKGLHKTEIRKAVYGGNSKIDQAIAKLMDDGEIERASRRYFLVESS